jgi:hypothetical protein
MKNYLYLMRLSVAILVAMNFGVIGNCQTQLIENFSYSSGTLLTSNGWNAHDAAGTNPVVVGSKGLVFPGYPSSDIGLSALLANTGEDVNKTFTTLTTGTVFCAFLVQVNAIAKEYFFHLTGSPVLGQRGRVYIDGTGNSFNFGLSKGTGNTVFTTGTPFTTGVTYLIILKYSIVEGTSNDEVSLYIISGMIPDEEPVVPSIGPLSDAGQSDLANVSAVALRQNSSNLNVLIDGIRVASKWEDVVSAPTNKEDLPTADDPYLYPVPVSAELFVSNCHNVVVIEIFDFSGRKLISVNAGNNNTVKIPVDQLPRGLYILRLKTSGSIKIMKFIKS